MAGRRLGSVLAFALLSIVLPGGIVQAFPIENNLSVCQVATAACLGDAACAACAKATKLTLPQPPLTCNSYLLGTRAMFTGAAPGCNAPVVRAPLLALAECVAAQRAALVFKLGKCYKLAKDCVQNTVTVVGAGQSDGEYMVLDGGAANPNALQTWALKVAPPPVLQFCEWRAAAENDKCDDGQPLINSNVYDCGFDGGACCPNTCVGDACGTVKGLTLCNDSTSVNKQLALFQDPTGRLYWSINTYKLGDTDEVWGVDKLSHRIYVTADIDHPSKIKGQWIVCRAGKCEPATRDIRIGCAGFTLGDKPVGGIQLPPTPAPTRPPTPAPTVASTVLTTSAPTAAPAAAETPQPTAADENNKPSAPPQSGDQQTYTMTMVTVAEGQAQAAFTTEQQAAFAKAVAGLLGLPNADGVSITAVGPPPTARRTLSTAAAAAAAQPLLRRRLATAADGFSVQYEVLNVKSKDTASEYGNTLINGSDTGVLLDDFKREAAAAGAGAVTATKLVTTVDSISPDGGDGLSGTNKIIIGFMVILALLVLSAVIVLCMRLQAKRRRRREFENAAKALAIALDVNTAPAWTAESPARNRTIWRRAAVASDPSPPSKQQQQQQQPVKTLDDSPPAPRRMSWAAGAAAHAARLAALLRLGSGADAAAAARAARGASGATGDLEGGDAVSTFASQRNPMLLTSGGGGASGDGSARQTMTWHPPALATAALSSNNPGLIVAPLTPVNVGAAAGAAALVIRQASNLEARLRSNTTDGNTITAPSTMLGSQPSEPAGWGLEAATAAGAALSRPASAAAPRPPRSIARARPRAVSTSSLMSATAPPPSLPATPTSRSRASSRAPSRANTPGSSARRPPPSGGYGSAARSIGGSAASAARSRAGSASLSRASSASDLGRFSGGGGASLGDMGGADFESVNGTPPWARDVMALCERAAQLFGTGASLSNNCRVIAWWATDVQAALDSLAAQLDNDPHAADHVSKEAVERAEDNLQELVALAKQHMHHGTLPLFALLRRTKELVDGAAADLRAALVGTLPADDLQMLTAPRLRVDNSVAPVLQSIGRSPNSGRPRTYSMQRSP